MHRIKDEDKTKEQLINELNSLRQMLAKFEASEGKGMSLLRKDKDISEKINAELLELTLELEGTLVERTAELKQLEEKYRSIFENAVEGIFQTTPDGHYISANPALARMYGYNSPEELIASLTDIKGQLYADENRRSEFIRLIEAHGIVSNFQSQIYRKDSSIISISENARAVHDASGNPLYYEGMVEDITERKRAEEELLKKTSELEAIFKAIPDLFFWLNSEGTILDYKAERVSDLYISPEKFLGKRMQDVLPLDLGQKVD